VKKLPNIVNSCFSNVHLVSLCYAPDLKTYGYEAILSKFVSEIKQLSVNGFTGNFPGLGSQKIYVSRLQFACDNLALNGLLGYIESFSADYFCTICYAKQAENQCKFYENEYELRLISKHFGDVAQIAFNQALTHSHGIKSDCILYQIPGFYATQNFSLDIMHIVLERIISVELSCVVYHLCRTYKKLSMSGISTHIRTL